MRKFFKQLLISKNKKVQSFQQETLKELSAIINLQVIKIFLHN
jgi:hypothetical protein